MEGSRATFVAFVQGTRTVPVGFVAKSQDFLPGAGAAWQPQEAFSPVSWLPKQMIGKVQREIIEPFITKLVKEGTPYSGFLTFDLVIGRQKIYLCGARSTPDSLSLAALATADQRDWLAIIRFLLGMSALADVDVLHPTVVIPTVAIAPPFDISVPPTVASADDLGEARALAMDAFSKTYPLAQGVEKRLIEKPIGRMAKSR